MTETAFHNMHQKLMKGDESLFLKIFSTHFQDCRNYLMDKHGVSHEKAYDICMETLLDFREKLMDQKIKFGNLRFLFTRMAVNKFIDESKKSKKTVEAVHFMFNQNKIKEIDKELYYELLQKAMCSLKESHRQLIEDIFFAQKDMKHIAEEYNTSYVNIRKKKERLLSKLKTTFFDLINELN